MEQKIMQTVEDDGYYQTYSLSNDVKNKLLSANYVVERYYMVAQNQNYSHNHNQNHSKGKSSINNTLSSSYWRVTSKNNK
jgi:hypothetical protein